MCRSQRLQVQFSGNRQANDSYLSSQKVLCRWMHRVTSPTETAVNGSSTPHFPSIPKGFPKTSLASRSQSSELLINKRVTNGEWLKGAEPKASTGFLPFPALGSRDLLQKASVPRLPWSSTAGLSVAECPTPGPRTAAWQVSLSHSLCQNKSCPESFFQIEATVNQRIRRSAVLFACDSSLLPTKTRTKPLKN